MFCRFLKVGESTDTTCYSLLFYWLLNRLKKKDPILRWKTKLRGLVRATSYCKASHNLKTSVPYIFLNKFLLLVKKRESIANVKCKYPSPQILGRFSACNRMMHWHVSSSLQWTWRWLTWRRFAIWQKGKKYRSFWN